MGKIFYMMGKSASGKDTIFRILKDELPLRTVILYTTRPIRVGEQDGVTYHFVSEDKVKEFAEAGRIIELRDYATVHGSWKYFTADDGQIDLAVGSYLMIGTLESYEKTREYFGEDAMEPILIEVENGERLQRALDRERGQKNPRYAEMCRRFLADEEDFAEEKILAAGITVRYQNLDSEACAEEIAERIKAML